MPLLFQPPRLLVPSSWRGLRVGLLGGSFNPPHDGHVHISLTALRALGLDCVWWLVSPQNPLKASALTASYASRLERSRIMTRNHPRLIVSDLERRLGTSYTVDTLTRLLPAFPDARFVWLTGLDNALTFHRWHRWQDILALVPTAHIARPPALSLIRNCPLKHAKAQRQTILGRPACPPLEPGSTYWIISNKLNFQSSTLLRG